MTRKKALCIYLSCALGQILAVCVIVFLLRRGGVTVDYTSAAGIIAVAAGGISTALWGSVLSVKYHHRTAKRILTDFFNVRQNYKAYLMVLMFLLLDFFYLFCGGRLIITQWYIPLILFVKALLFGGIEEIGWRYFFQPTLQEKLGYIPSTLITFLFWGIWHFSFFYIDGTLAQTDTYGIMSFLLGLLVNCFILSALYIRTKSLWICVMTHSLINVFSQTAEGGNIYVRVICCIMIIAAAVLSSKKAQR